MSFLAANVQIPKPIIPILVVIAVLVGLYIIWLILKDFLLKTGKVSPLLEEMKGVKFAHRGLHSDTVAENSMTAFRLAKEHGYGIELDIRLTKDGELVVFHDATLERVCGVDGKVIDYTYEELSQLSLLGTADTIPLFSDVLQEIDGAIPLLVEIKLTPDESGVAEKLYEEIKDYQGKYIVESFNPFPLRTFKKLMPQVPIGFLSTRYSLSEKHRGKLLYTLLQKLYFNFLMRPSFIAYEKDGYAEPNLIYVRKKYMPALLAWTVKSKDEERDAIARGFDTVIFENYIPD